MLFCHPGLGYLHQTLVRSQFLRFALSCGCSRQVGLKNNLDVVDSFPLGNMFVAVERKFSICCFGKGPLVMFHNS